VTCLVVTVAAIIAGVIIGRVNNANGRPIGIEANTPNIRDLIPTNAEDLTNAGLDALSDVVRADGEAPDTEENDSVTGTTNVPLSDSVNIPLPNEVDAESGAVMVQ